MGAPGWGWPGNQCVPRVLPGPGEVVIRNTAPTLPARRGEGAALPAAAREPPGWEWEAAREKSGARNRAAAAAEGLPRHLEACDSLRKAGGPRLQCAQSFGWRAKTQARAAAPSGASCGQNRRATPGGPHADSPTLGQAAFAPRTLA